MPRAHSKPACARLFVAGLMLFAMSSLALTGCPPPPSAPVPSTSNTTNADAASIPNTTNGAATAPGTTDDGAAGTPETTAENAAGSSTPPEAESSESSDVAANVTPSTPPEGKVLRHAVFFSFKEESSEEDVQGVVEAFADLPSKIKEITTFEWGTNNSPEGKADGFTHCFLLTFKDEAGRSVYLPHDQHKAFGAALRPHLSKVFVIDYWGDEGARPEKALRHAVFFKFKDDADPAAVAKVEEAFAALPGKIDAIKDFEWGTNNSPEQHAHGFTHCFLVTFDSEEGREAYLPHPDHKKFVEVLLPVLDKVRVLDYWAQ